ncbi:MAG: XdhC family protein [Candidatus Kariarchaeaceae archaeon]
MKDLKLWKNALESLESGEKTILCIVVSHTGSTPGKTGFKMLVKKTGEFIGTIGGGKMERKLLDRCQILFSETSFTTSIITQSHYANAPEEERSGLICSGSQDILITQLKTKNLDDIRFIVASYGDEYFGVLSIDRNGLSIDPNTEIEKKYLFNSTDELNWSYQETIGKPNIAYVFGGGHVGTAVCRILSTLDFYIIQFDNRDDIPLADNYAHETIQCPFFEVGQYIKNGDRSYFIVVTFSSDTDAEVLGQILGKKAKFMGLMGSKTKVAKIFNIMRSQGFSKELDQVIAPIGIELHDETVEEIAISIAAQLVKIKNEPPIS